MPRSHGDLTLAEQQELASYWELCGNFTRAYPRQLVEHAELALLVARRHTSGRTNAFLRSVWRRFAEDHPGGVTPAQLSVLEHMLQEENGTVQSAMVTDMVHIPNGRFTLTEEQEGGQSISIEIYTVTRGSLVGKRIIKRKMADGTFKGYAFLLTNGSIRVWQRHLEEIHNTPYDYLVRGFVRWMHGRVEYPYSERRSRPLFDGLGTSQMEMDHPNYGVVVRTVGVHTRLQCRVCNSFLGGDYIDWRHTTCSDQARPARRVVSSAQAAQAGGTSLDRRRIYPDLSRPSSTTRGRTARTIPLSELGTGEIL